MLNQDEVIEHMVVIIDMAAGYLNDQKKVYEKKYKKMAKQTKKDAIKLRDLTDEVAAQEGMLKMIDEVVEWIEATKPSVKAV